MLLGLMQQFYCYSRKCCVIFAHLLKINASVQSKVYAGIFIAILLNSRNKGANTSSSQICLVFNLDGSSVSAHGLCYEAADSLFT
jgi:hypothetical protein